jgi:hypothetical protein
MKYKGLKEGHKQVLLAADVVGGWDVGIDSNQTLVLKLKTLFWVALFCLLGLFVLRFAICGIEVYVSSTKIVDSCLPDAFEHLVDVESLGRWMQSFKHR